MKALALFQKYVIMVNCKSIIMEWYFYIKINEYKGYIDLFQYKF